MNLYLLLIIILMIIGSKIHIKGFNGEYLSKETTACIKGVFILIVFFSHVASDIVPNMAKDGIIYNLRYYLGQLMVAMFMFYSGYGIATSIKKKQEKYVKSLPVNRILKTLIHFDFVVLIYVLVLHYLGNDLPISRILYSFTAWVGVGNSNWYIFAILVLYLTSYISFSLSPKNEKVALGLNLALSIGAMVIIGAFRGAGFEYCYNTMLCYNTGLYYAFYKERIEEALFNNRNYLLILLCGIVFLIGIKRIENLSVIYFILESIVFVFTIVLATMKINITNKILKWFGDNLFWIYILQRIPMIILKNSGYNLAHPYRYFALSFITTIILTVVIKPLVERIDKLIYTK